jgi:uncharacterized protein (DUF1800 family)
MKTWMAALAAVAWLFASPLAAQDGEPLFEDGFDPPFAFPDSDAEAARFLNQATFGATRPEIAQVRSVGYEEWLRQQIAVPRSFHRQPLEQLAAGLASGTSIDQGDRVRRFWQVAITGPDQLRQKTAWALSQIIVVSDQNDLLADEPLLMADWHDLLARNAFGSYRTLLAEATRHPAMGRYLTSLRNRKFEGNVTPDENYAREVMQLFSIGLVDRAFDFTPRVDGNGNPLPTYDMNTITAVARVFTGLAHDCTGDQQIPGTGITVRRTCGTGCTGLDCRFTNTGTLYFNDPPRDNNAANLVGTTAINRGLRHPDFFRPMVCYVRYHDTGRDLAGNLWDGNGTPPPTKLIEISGGQSTLEIPASPAGSDCRGGSATPPADRVICTNYCEESIDRVDLLFQHPNTPPMVARQLIQRFVTSNPSPGYIRRVACTFAGTSARPEDCPEPTGNARGDLAATLIAVLTDAEARRPLALPGTSPNVGKPREPLLKLAQAWRSFGAVLPPLTTRNWGPTGTIGAYGQRPLGAPTVFNFFQPDYQQPGAIADAGLYSPELQIVNETTLINAANDLFGRVCAGYGNNDCAGAFASTPPTDRAYLPPAVLDALPTDPVQLVNEINIRLFGGGMSGSMNPAGQCFSGVGTGMQGALYFMLRCQMGPLGNTVNDRRRRALYLLHLALISPEFAVQR